MEEVIFDDDNQKKKRKRKTDNPLSRARGKQKRPENVWFRRSKAGYSLFVQYYLEQPEGTVCNFSSEAGTVVECELDTVKRNGSIDSRPNGAGLSRAAKRRMKKKDKTTGSKGVVHRTDNENNVDNVDQSKPGTSISQLDSPLLEAYLKAPSSSKPDHDQDFRSFLTALSRKLPISFRIRQSLSALDIQNCRETIEREFPEFVTNVAFHPNIYQARKDANLSKERLDEKSPKLKQFLLKYSQNGAIARQEIGSMLPVLFLAQSGKLQKSSRVVDMCASPGSKTLQALEIIDSKGRVVANDVSSSRIEALRQALERSGVSNQLLSRVAYSCQDGTTLQPPLFKKKSSKDKLGWNVVICDVPCSGDGTCRKDKHILPMWKPNYGNDLHEVQISILIRAIELVEVGGVVCYSTCSLNPVEDEAVVAAAIKEIHGRYGSKSPASSCVELLLSPSFPGFVGRPGVYQWKVAEYQEDSLSSLAVEDEEIPKLRWHESCDTARTANMEGKILRSMWPPPLGDAKKMHLERCTRLWPQDQDTGGFFVALLQKNA